MSKSSTKIEEWSLSESQWAQLQKYAPTTQSSGSDSTHASEEATEKEAVDGVSPKPHASEEASTEYDQEQTKAAIMMWNRKLDAMEGTEEDFNKMLYDFCKGFIEHPHWYALQPEETLDIESESSDAETLGNALRLRQKMVMFKCLIPLIVPFRFLYQQFCYYSKLRQAH